MLQKPRGTRDFLPDEMEHRRAIEQCMRETARRWGYREICTPTFETQELYTLRSGEGIINEMYAFEDKGGRKLALRPEGTAGVLRMYVNEAQVMPKPLRWCYISDCYRYERPQKGRYRQFWQFGIELIGADTAAADAEVILVADDILRKSGVVFDLQAGHLAPMKHLLRELESEDQTRILALIDKRNFEGLNDYLSSPEKSELLDALTGLVACRDVEEVIEISGDFPEKERLRETIEILDKQELRYTFNPAIVRGLDYYTGMVFEGFAENLGAENQIIGGGAYRLAHLFGGDAIASSGFGIGFDRVMVALGEKHPSPKGILGVIYTADTQAHAFSVAKSFRDAGITTELNLMERGIGAQIKHASKSAEFIVVMGKRECEAGTVTLKDLTSGEQKECSIEAAIAGVKGVGRC